MNHIIWIISYNLYVNNNLVLIIDNSGVLPPPTLEIVAAPCGNSWDSYVLSGKFQAVGGFGDYAIYTKRTIDANGNWWFFYFDTSRDGWRFAYSGVKTVAGVSLWGTTVTPFDKDRQGQFLNNYDDKIQIIFRIRSFTHAGRI